ncbi:MAG: RodZ domain-containing protein [Thermodesulfobacteriota bacterium]
MESPGEYLKREREIRGIKLSEVFEATRVPKKSLEALEADEYDSMPHPTFVKGYIKAYCKVLGVDETDAVLRYEIYLREKSLKAGDAKAESRTPVPKSVKEPPLLGEFWRSKRNVVLAAAGAAVLIIIIIASIFIPRKGPAPVPVAQTVEERAVPGTAPEAAPERAPAVEKKPAPRKAARPVPAEKKPAAPAVAEQAKPRHSLVVKATDTVWVQAVIDGKEPFDVTLKPGEKVVWKAVDGLVLKIGNAGGVELAFDGKPLAPVGEPGYVVSLSLPGGKVKVLARPKPAPVKPASPALEDAAVEGPPPAEAPTVEPEAEEGPAPAQVEKAAPEAPAASEPVQVQEPAGPAGPEALKPAPGQKPVADPEGAAQTTEAGKDGDGAPGATTAPVQPPAGDQVQ